MNLRPRTSNDASITPTSNGFQLRIPASSEHQYRLAQIDNYARMPRYKFSAEPPLTLSLLARTSSETIPGTWGFGLWNDPFGLSFGFGGNPLCLPALPNAIWFFHSSPKNYLSFQNDKPAQGFLAQIFRSPRFHPYLPPVSLILPFSKKKARKLLGRIIEEDADAIHVDVTQWHKYQLKWSPGHSSFLIDEISIFETDLSPHPPLGLVIWIDNQFAAFTPEGEMKWGVEKNPSEARLEIEAVELTK